MPIYEFYCERCNTIYKFFSKRINTEKTPDCPSCRDIKLIRRPSVFATFTKGEEGTDEDMPAFDERRMERVLSELARDAEGLNEDDPRQAAQLMRRLTDATGLRMGTGMEEALRRLERGDDPEKIEDEMGDIFDEEEPFTFGETHKKSLRKPSPMIDETLYEL